MLKKHVLVAAAASMLAASGAMAQLMVPDSGSGDRIMLFDAFDGSIIDLNWLTDIGAVGWEFSTPKEAVMVNGELWVADQLEDAVHRFDSGLNFIGSITGDGVNNMDNIRSLGTDGSTVWVTNSAGFFDDAVISYDTNGNFLDYFPVNTTSIFDAEPFMGDLLVTDASNDLVSRWGTDGTFMGNFATGQDFPEQLVVLPDNSVLVAAAIGAEAVWHFNADGTVREYIDVTGLGTTLRGVYLLGNGNYFLSTGAGIYVASDNGGGYDFTLITDEPSGQYVTVIPAPGTVAMLGLAGLLARRRR